MIINKKFADLKGVIEYEVIVSDSFSLFNYDCECEDEIEIFEYDKFSNLNELLVGLSDSRIEKIKRHYNEIYANSNSEVEEVCVRNIIFTTYSLDKKTQSRMSISETGVHGWSTVEINNEDIEHRLVSNLEQVKKIIDNTLEEYPIKFTRE